jgi:hypothetical protein
MELAWTIYTYPFVFVRPCSFHMFKENVSSSFLKKYPIKMSVQPVI